MNVFFVFFFFFQAEDGIRDYKVTGVRRVLFRSRLVDRSGDFFGRLRGVTHPEGKRAIIGETFVAVQEDEFARLGLREGEWLLGQGTIYPDTIESGGARHAAKIKT